MIKIKAFFKWFIIMILLNVMFIVPESLILDFPLNLILALVWGFLVGIVCLPLFLKFINIKIIKIKDVKFNMEDIAYSVGCKNDDFTILVEANIKKEEKNVDE